MPRAPDTVTATVLAAALSSSGAGCGSGGSPSDASVADAPVDANEASTTYDAPSGPADAGPGATDSSPDADAAFEAGCPVCPISAPEAGAPCALASPTCEYGDDPRTINPLAMCIDGHWWYQTQSLDIPLADSGAAVGDGGCPAGFVAAEFATSCDVPVCTYPEGTCTCFVSERPPDSGTYWSCGSLALPPGCPATLAAAMVAAEAGVEDGGCPGADLGCYYPGGSCVCSPNDAGTTWRCTVPAANCPSVRPRIGSACDPTSQSQPCTYLPISCATVTGDLVCDRVAPAPCGGAWTSLPGALCQ
jgi:hypothetical protein